MNVVNWLLSCGCRCVRPVEVSIGKETWQGARYLDVNGEETVYLLGNVPAAKIKRKSTCFTFEGADWYVSGWWDAEAANRTTLTKELREQYHPFGYYFMMRPWPNKFGRIDDGERYAYKRVPMSMKEVVDATA